LKEKKNDIEINAMMDWHGMHSTNDMLKMIENENKVGKEQAAFWERPY
jgi:hypothetical protein